MSTNEIGYQGETAKNASSTQKNVAPHKICLIRGFLFPHAIHSAESSAPNPSAEERKPKPVGPTLSTFVAKSGSKTLKLMPNREMIAMTPITISMEGVRRAYTL